ncbi:MAG: M20 family peptidase, partial [Comamonas sp.]|nr:M20 family peptidase [Comamonas sp.]
MPWHSIRTASAVSTLLRALPLALTLTFGAAHAAPQAELLELAKKEQQPLLDTLRDLVHIESGSKDVEGLKKIADYIAGKLRAQGGKVEVITPTDIYRLDDTPEKLGPMVHAEFKGQGTSRIMLIAHM